MMKSQFSLLYDGQPFCGEIDTEGDGRNQWELAPDVFVTANVKRYPRYDAAEWVLSFDNNGEEPSKVISDIWDCDSFLPLDAPEWSKVLYLPEKNSLCVVTMNGTVPSHNYWENDQVTTEEFRLCPEYLERAPQRTKRFANQGGRSSDGMMPIFDVTANGAGYIVAIGWTGDWKSEFVGSQEGVTVRTGLKHTGFYLKSGEKLRTSSFLVMKYTSQEDRYNKFRGLMREHFSPKTGNGLTQNNLLAFELWGNLSSEEMIKRVRELKEHEIGFEKIWIDAAWYGEREKGYWSNQTGDWKINTEDHPDLLQDVRREVEDAGMKLMLWIEPERAKTNTELFADHPDWFLSLPNQMGEHGDHVLNYGNAEARQYAFDLIDHYVETLSLGCYRQDFNIDLTPYFEECDEEDRVGITQIKHIMGMYEIWDRLLERHPDLVIDNCSSGGKRIDIETMKRSIPFFRSDYQCNFNENPEVLQTHNSNSSVYIPSMGCTSKTKSDTYAARSSFSTSWGGAFYNREFQSMDEADFAWAKKTVDEYKRIRRYFSKDFYNHASAVFDPTAWVVWQYHDAEANRGILMAFRRERSPFSSVEITLKGIDENSRLEFLNLDTSATWNGSRDLTLSLPEKRTSVVVEYSVMS